MYKAEDSNTIKNPIYVSFFPSDPLNLIIMNKIILILVILGILILLCGGLMCLSEAESIQKESFLGSKDDEWIREHIKQNKTELILAPLHGFTDVIFRSIFSKYFSGFDEAIAPFISTMGSKPIMYISLKGK